MHRPQIVWMLTLMATGCSPDDRAEQLARESLEFQREQNRLLHESQTQLGRTTGEVAQQGRELAKTAERLVENDSSARKDLILAHREMRGELHAERVSVDEQRASLEGERREIASQRVTEPLIAEAIQAAALWAAAILPIWLAGYVLYSVNRSTDDQAAVNEVLVVDLASEQPRLLPPRESPRLEGPAGRAALPAPEHPDGPPPF